ncbi:sugar ABC transporter ATP-binding protein [Peribacillus saganii]|uniref:Sugar ABC transporter ATP-binding protein n=1 Tax=Peribacillus saganii TaxID=2303992 RepID=A0A372LEA9_9BACI|nr:sugar ABC transporter ATP-binding protein [Peribacillus saganii]RFU64638.1 sugar ABC transporter ATP-binding protein [Peribacillus saganii]
MNLLTIEKLTKQFGGNTALNSIDLVIRPGEIHSLIGENGAGKSTLIKMITGVYQPSSGNIAWEGQTVQINSPKEAQNLGINVIHQDRQLVSYFTGLENLFLNHPYPKKKAWFGIDWKAMKREAQTLQEKWGMNLPLHLPVSAFAPAERTLLEILRTMMSESKLLILDEPTASLTDKESELLFSFIERLKLQGVAIIYISHRLEEVIRLSDRVTVLTGGKLTATLEQEQLSKELLISKMTGGQEIERKKQPQTNRKNNEALLKVRNLRTKDQTVSNVSFHLKKGEILGVYGLAGSGRTECMEAIYGLRKLESGTIWYQNQEITNASPQKSLGNGMVLIPENRHGDALIMKNTIRENMTLPILKSVTKHGIVQRNIEITKVQEEMKRFQLKAIHEDQPVSELSGGNQQKVVFAKGLLSNPDIYLCDEPTQAVDVMTRLEIHLFLKDQALQGKGIIYVSSDLHEILEVSDRVVVFSEGKTVAELDNAELQPNDILDICYRLQKEAL